MPSEGSKVTDDTRIRETLPTLRLAIERGARLVLASHLGRPKGKLDPKYSLAPVAAMLEGVARQAGGFCRRTAWAPTPNRRARRFAMAEVLLLENVRFHPEEEANDPRIFEAARGFVR